MFHTDQDDADQKVVHFFRKVTSVVHCFLILAFHIICPFCFFFFPCYSFLRTPLSLSLSLLSFILSSFIFCFLLLFFISISFPHSPIFDFSFLSKPLSLSLFLLSSSLFSQFFFFLFLQIYLSFPLSSFLLTRSLFLSFWLSSFSKSHFISLYHSLLSPLSLFFYVFLQIIFFTSHPFSVPFFSHLLLSLDFTNIYIYMLDTPVVSDL
ncbi:unnamed protein product [Acanthosepion pharaonis]|uniref:Uncharacterized protein n=1 Tax=Acanthosepion pharaonis TaxID=158019 RepID=A0A812D8J2_ACAPH|nr:unnamed protein product [Sepia pharaonis]